MNTFLFYHPACLEHDTGFDHPESAERLKAVINKLSEPTFSDLKWHRAPRVEHGQIARVHDGEYISKVMNSGPENGRVIFEPTGTVVSGGSAEAALRAAGAVCAAVDAVVRGEAKNAFCAVRPPGHHSERGRTSGFCLFNNVAIGARHAQQVHNLRRVAIIDFDVHHGNGTEDIFTDDPSVFFASTHQSFLFPNTGRAEEKTPPHIVNVNLARGWGGDKFRTLFSEKVIPRLTYFAPELILVSAGFDADRRDPIGGLKFDPEDYVWVTQRLLKVANKCCGGKMVSALEGGYSPSALASCCAAHVKTLMAA